MKELHELHICLVMLVTFAGKTKRNYCKVASSVRLMNSRIFTQNEQDIMKQSTTRKVKPRLHGLSFDMRQFIKKSLLKSYQL